MSDTVTRAHVEAIRSQVDRASAYADADDPVGAGVQARLAAEGMLHALCDLNGVAIPAGSPGEGMIGTQRKALRHAKVLDRKLEDAFSHIQNVGNRAAHHQAEPGLAVDAAEARVLVQVLEHAWDGFVTRLPPALRPAIGADAPPAPGLLWRWTLRLGAAVLLLVTPIASFLLVIAMLGGPERTNVPLAPLAAAPAAPARVEDLLAETDAAPEPTPGPERVGPDVLATIRADRVVTPTALAPLDCDALATARNQVFARHGLRFRTEEARAAFEGTPGYQPFTDDLGLVTEAFTENDRRNVGRIEEALGLEGCACPRRAKEPCPR